MYLRSKYYKNIFQLALLFLMLYANNIDARKSKGLSKKCLKKICKKTFKELDKDNAILIDDYQDKLREMSIPLAQFAEIDLSKLTTLKLQRLLKSKTKIPKKYKIKNKTTIKVIKLAMDTYRVLRWYKSALTLTPYSGLDCVPKRKKRQIFQQENQIQCSSHSFKKSCVHTYIENAQNLLESLHMTHKLLPEDDLIMRCLYNNQGKAEKKIKKLLPKNKKETCGILSPFIYDKLQDSVTKMGLL